MQNYLSKWWLAKKGEVHNDLIPSVKYIFEQQTLMRDADLHYASMYCNMDLMGISPIAFSQTISGSMGPQNKVEYNVIKSCIDTAGAKISAKRPKPMFLTEGGKWEQKETAKKLNTFVDGLFYDGKLYSKLPLTFTHSGIFGTGAIKVFSERGKIHFETRLKNEILIDDSDGFYGSPQTLYEYPTVDRELLKAAYPKYSKQIDDLPRVSFMAGSLVNHHADQVNIVEAWRLPVLDYSDPKNIKTIYEGRHVIAIGGVDLLDEPYMKTKFPFAFYHWDRKPFGFWGQGIAESLAGKHVEINKLLRLIQEAHYYCSSPMWMKEKGSQILDTQLNNLVGNILTYSGTKPSLEVFQAISPEVYNHLKWLIQSCYEEIGITQLSAAGRNPFGANASGKALTTYNDIETERFMIAGQNWEQFVLDIADLAIEEAVALNQKGINVSVVGSKVKEMQKIDFSKIDYDKSKFFMKCFPVSLLSSTPSAKMSEVSEMMGAGIIDPEQGRRLLDFPDLESFNTVTFAKRSLIEKLFNEIVENGTFTPVEPFMDLAYVVDFGSNFYNLMKIDGLPESKLELIRLMIEQAEQMLRPPQQVPSSDQMPMNQMDMMSEEIEPELTDDELLAMNEAAPIQDAAELETL